MKNATLNPFHLSRREWLHWLSTSAMGTTGLAVSGLSLSGEVDVTNDATAVMARLAAVWQDRTNGMAQDWAGVLSAAVGPDGQVAWNVAAKMALPTRGHGVQRLPDGQIVFAARRPGDWLVRWQPEDGKAHWAWMDEDRCFNGHVVLAGDATVHAHGGTSGSAGILLTTETDLEDSQGCIGLRDARTLEKRAEWRTHGMDPHELIVLAEAVGPYPAGTLIVANGGIPTQSETGRSKKWLDGMDPSLVALDPRDGRLLGQWKLPDPRLSIRHLAWDSERQIMGIALQAEHSDARRQGAPVFAVWNGRELRAAQDQPPLAGYGGSVECAPGLQGGFVVSCPRSNCLARFDTQGRYVGAVEQADVCPLARDGERLWSGGQGRVTLQNLKHAGLASDNAPGVQLDNHWRLLREPGEGARRA
ncbi:MAG: DUF1513 domain-containing protein [Burkholderiaceae bacterium]|nr:DUF1513 domain-containing protein [Burkholderiaceae bacterium]